MTWRRLQLLWAALALAGVLALPLAASAQAPLPPPGPAAAPSSQIVQRPPGLGTPRQALQTYFEAMDAGDMRLAATALDTSLIPASIRAEEGARMAVQLLGILNRTATIDLSLVPDAEEGDAYTLASFQGGLAIQVSRGQDKGWRVSAESLARLDRIWNLVSDQESIAGLRVIDAIDFDPSQAVRQAVPEGLRKWRVFGLEAWQLLSLLIGALMGALLGLAAAAAARWKAKLLDRPIRRGLSHGIGAVAGMLLFQWLVPYMGLPPAKLAAVRASAGVLLTAALVLVLWHGWTLACRSITSRLASRHAGAEKLFLPVIQRFGHLLLVVGAMFFVGGLLGVNATGLFAGLGIGTAIVALAAKDSVENLFGSMTVLFERPFVIGDWVKVGDTEGIVEDITLRSTRIRTFADSIIVLPNSRLVTAPVENFGRRRARRCRQVLQLTALAPSDEIAGLVAVLQKHLDSREDLQDGTRWASLHDLAPAGPQVLVSCYIEVDSFAEELRVKQEILSEMLRQASDRGLLAPPAPPA